jgi:hypothetical protein
MQQNSALKAVNRANSYVLQAREAQRLVNEDQLQNSELKDKALKLALVFRKEQHPSSSNGSHSHKDKEDQPRFLDLPKRLNKILVQTTN